MKLCIYRVNRSTGQKYSGEEDLRGKKRMLQSVKNSGNGNVAVWKLWECNTGGQDGKLRSIKKNGRRRADI